MRISVENVADGETLSLHLPLLIGEIQPLSSATVRGHVDVWNSSCPENKKTRWPVVQGNFKALTRLRLGENKIHIQYESEILTIHLIREYPSFIHFVRPVYIVCADDDGYFQGPEDEDCSPSSALARISLAAMLNQTFTAEKMKEHGFGRCTFQLETDASHDPVCHIFHSKLTLEKALHMTGNELWAYFAKELMTSEFPSKDVCKWFCFMSFTRYFLPEGSLPKTHSEILKYTRGHTALGGGGLALFGTGNLHTWACSVEEIHKRFTDNRKIDRSKFMDDSAYREYYWANYATGLGASLHELGHTFDLAHTPTGIMARGFDDIYKVFTVQRTKSRDRSRTRQHYRNRSSSQDSVSRTSSTSSIESATGSSLSADEGQGENHANGTAHNNVSTRDQTKFVVLSTDQQDNNVKSKFCNQSDLQQEVRGQPNNVESKFCNQSDLQQEVRGQPSDNKSSSSLTEAALQADVQGNDFTQGRIQSSTTPLNFEPFLDHSTENGISQSSCHSNSPCKRPSQLDRTRDVCFGSPLKKTGHASSNYVTPAPVVVKMESGFKPVKSPSTLTFSVKNYDGTQSYKTVSHEDGFETVTDMLVDSDGRLLVKSARRERTSSCSSVSSTSSNPQSPITATPSNLPNSPEEPLVFPEITFKDGGAHWYRSSAVLLYFHKWFNKPNALDTKRQPIISGSKVTSSAGIRLVELRSDPEGVVFHHWEFLTEIPPAKFVLMLSSLKNFPAGASVVTVLVEDSFGNIARRKVKVEDFQR